MNYLKYIDIIIPTSGDSNSLFENCFELVNQTTEQFNTFISGCNANSGFSRSVNRVIKIINSEYICLLNDDTEPQKDWLLHLINRMESDKEIGICSSKLLYPDSDIIQHAGMGLKDKTVILYGRGKPDSKEFNIAKEIDYVTFACVLLRKEMISEIGLLDEQFEFFFEDMDYCMRARKAGWKVFYEPKSVVYHHESSTIHKKELVWLCDKNKKKFLNKWNKEEI